MLTPVTSKTLHTTQKHTTSIWWEISVCIPEILVTNGTGISEIQDNVAKNTKVFQNLLPAITVPIHRKKKDGGSTFYHNALRT